MRRMRTIQQAAAWVKETDPHTALTRTAIRRLVLSGVIPHITAGNKRLIALEDVEEYLNCGSVPVPSMVGIVRPVEVRR